jgi:hypothetical protein
MEKELILKQLEEAKIQEELAIPLYVSHIKETIFWSGLEPEKQAEIINSLKILDIESEGHAKAFEEMIEKYKNL